MLGGISKKITGNYYFPHNSNSPFYVLLNIPSLLTREDVSNDAREPAKARHEGACEVPLLAPPELWVSTVTLVESLTATVSVEPRLSQADQLRMLIERDVLQCNILYNYLKLVFTSNTIQLFLLKIKFLFSTINLL